MLLTSIIAAAARHFSNARARHRAGRRAVARNGKHLAEPLERRLLLDGNIYGTEGDDIFVITVDSDNRIQLTFNGVPDLLFTTEDRINVWGYGGNDQFILINTGRYEWDLWGGNGSDTYTVGNGRARQNILRTVSINDVTIGHTGHDRLFVNDSLGASGGGTTWGLGSQSAQILSSTVVPAPRIVYGMKPTDEVHFTGSIYEDTLFISGLRPNLTFDLGDGNDTADFGGLEQRMNYAIPQNVTILGGAGDNHMVLDERDSTTPLPQILIGAPVGENRYEVLGGVHTDRFERLTVRTSEHAGTAGQPVVFRGNSSPGSRITIIGSSGADEVRLGTVAQPIAVAQQYAVSMFLQLGGGYNRFASYESHAAQFTVSRAYSFNGTGIFYGSGSGLNVTFDVFLDATVTGGAGNDTFHVGAAVNPAVLLRLEGSTGNDQLTHGGADLDAIFSSNTITFDGGGGTDSVTANDSADQTGGFDQYRIQSFAIEKRDGGAPTFQRLLNMTGVENLNFTADNDSNVIYFQSLATLAAVTLNGGGGDDTFNNIEPGVVSGTLQLPSQLTITGGTGQNLLLMNDRNGSYAQYLLSTNSLLRSAGGTRALSYSGIASVQLDGPNAGASYEITSRGSGTGLVVNGGSGADEFFVGGGDIDFNGFTTQNTILSGGGGVDSITFDDRNDDYAMAANENEIYTLDATTMRKDTGGFTYSQFERQTVQVADRMTGNLLIDNTVRINSTAAGMLRTEIAGAGASRATAVHVGAAGGGNLSALSGDFAATFGGSANGLYLHDEAATAGVNYRVESGAISRVSGGSDRSIEYANVQYFGLYGSPFQDTMVFTALPAGAVAWANGNAGNDAMYLGDGQIGGVLGRINFDGGDGADTFEVNHAASAVPVTAVLTNNSFSFNGGPSHSLTINNVSLRFGSGADSLQLRSAGSSDRVLIDMGAGNDTVTAGNGDFDSNIVAFSDVTIDGGLGNDHLFIDDAADAPSTDDHYFTRTAGGDDRYSKANTTGLGVLSRNVEHRALDADNGSNRVFVHVGNSTASLRINTGGGNDFVEVNDSPLAAVYVNTGAGSDQLIVNNDFNTTNDAPATAIIDSADDINSLLVRPGGTLRVVSGGVVNKTALSNHTFNIAGSIDLAGGAMLMRSGSATPATLRPMIVSGRNGGTWDGTAAGAISSSLAASSAAADGIGYGLGSQIAPAEIGPYSISAADMLLRHTLDGDANLDLLVNAADHAILAQNYRLIGRTYAQGDLDYDVRGGVEASDLAMLASNIGPGATALFEPDLPIAGTTSVPDAILIALPGVPTGLDLANFTLRRNIDAPISLAGSGVTLTMVEPRVARLDGLAALMQQKGMYRLRLGSAGWTFGNGAQLAVAGEMGFHHYRVGDMDSNGVVNNLDIAPFVLGLTNVTSFEAQFGYSPILPGDINSDGLFNNLDIAPFVQLLTSGRTARGLVFGSATDDTLLLPGEVASDELIASPGRV